MVTETLLGRHHSLSIILLSLAFSSTLFLFTYLAPKKNLASRFETAVCCFSCIICEGKFFKLVDASKTTGESLYLQVKEELKKFKLASSQIVGTSFHDAANMIGRYKGLQVHLKMDNPNIQHVLGYADVLNLILTDATKCCKLTTKFLNLMQTATEFSSESYMRMIVWSSVNKESVGGNKLLRRLQK